MTINRGLTGMGDFNHRASVEEQRKASYSYGVPDERTFYLDTLYRGILDTIEGGSYDLYKALWQPLQVRIYDHDGVLVRITSNCHVGGFPNLEWTATGVFDSIPPPRQRMIDSTITFANDARHFLPLGRTTLSSIDTVRPTKDYTVVVYWTVMMGRQSERLIQAAKDAENRHADRYEVYYTCADNLFRKLLPR